MSKFKANSAVEYQDVFVASSTQSVDLGAYANTGDGREFRYAYDGGTALVAGKLYQGPAQDTTNYQNLAVAAAAAGATQVILTGSLTIAANALTGGLLIVSVAPGQGQTYEIASNTAVSAATGCVLTLADPIRVALTTSSRVDVQPNPFNGVVVQPTTQTSLPVGVAVKATSGTQYAWLQTHGEVGVLASGAITAGQPVAVSTTVAGAVQAATSGTQTIIGYAVTGIADTEYGLVYLNIN